MRSQNKHKYEDILTIWFGKKLSEEVKNEIEKFLSEFELMHRGLSMNIVHHWNVYRKSNEKEVS